MIGTCTTVGSDQELEAQSGIPQLGGDCFGEDRGVGDGEQEQVGCSGNGGQEARDYPEAVLSPLAAKSSGAEVFGHMQ